MTTTTHDYTIGSNTEVDWLGVHHLALITNDMDTTVRFWHGVLGAELVATIRTDEFLHYFFRVGSACTVAFFQYVDADVEQVTKPAGEYHRRAGHFDHLALQVADEAALEALRRRLLHIGCEVTEIVDHTMLKSVYFTDPSGIALEASCWVSDPTRAPTHSPDADHFGDPDPTAAVLEIQRGALNNLVTTVLS